MYGGAHTMTLRVAPEGETLEVDLAVTGLDTVVRQSMVDRVEALNGSLEDRAEGVVIRLPRSSGRSAVPVG
jgi:hypothetical protein